MKFKESENNRMEKVVFMESRQQLSIDRVIRDHDYSMDTKHFHSEYELYYLIKGQRYYFIENETYFVDEGSLVVINKNQVHKTAIYENPYHDRIVLGFPESVIAKVASLSDFHIQSFFQNFYGVIALTKDLQKQVQYLLLSIYKELKNKDSHSFFLVSMYLMEIILIADRIAHSNGPISRGIPVKSEKHNRVNQAASYIKNNYDKKLSLDNIADSQYINKSYLSRIFKEVTGFTVNEYLHICRVTQAKKLLEESDDSVHTIAKKVGFETASYFERIFKKYTEMTPLKHRKKYRNDTGY